MLSLWRTKWTLSITWCEHTQSGRLPVQAEQGRAFCTDSRRYFGLWPF